MAAIKPWYKIDGLTPREDLREGRPLNLLNPKVMLSDNFSPKINPA
jgi:hypothetical protein